MGGVDPLTFNYGGPNPPSESSTGLALTPPTAIRPSSLPAVLSYLRPAALYAAAANTSRSWPLFGLSILYIPAPPVLPFVLQSPLTLF